MKNLLFALAAVAPLWGQADRAAPRADPNSQLAHQQLLAKTKGGRIDIYFEGDSITRRWGATDYPQLLENWKRNFFGWNAADFGWGADRVENVLWRLENGELDGVNPKVIVLLAGTNNVGNKLPPNGIDAAVDDVTKGLAAVVRVMQSKASERNHHPDGNFPAQRQHGRDARDQSHQCQPGEDGGWTKDPLFGYQRPTGGYRWEAA